MKTDTEQNLVTCRTRYSIVLWRCRFRRLSVIAVLFLLINLSEISKQRSLAQNYGWY
jgi:hypothetical protein